MKRLMALSMLIPLCGCSFLAAKSQRITVTASDPEAEILVNGELLGKGHVECEVARGRNHTFIARKGDRSATKMLMAGNRSTVGKIDMFFGYLWVLPFFGLLSDGAYEFMTTHLSIGLPNVTVISGK